MSILPQLRMQAEKEFKGWSGKKPAAGFYSDKKVLNTFIKEADNYTIFVKISARVREKNNRLDAQTAKAVHNIINVTLRKLATGK